MSNNKNIENWINVTQKKKKQKVLFNNIPLKDILKHIHIMIEKIMLIIYWHYRIMIK